MSDERMLEVMRAWGEAGYPGPLAVNEKDGSVLVYVPEGVFEMGDGKFIYEPKHRVELSAYWIGVYAVTNAQYLLFVEATGHRAPDNDFHRNKERAAHPVTDVDWHDAQAYARWAGCDLPSEAQWERAARGPQGLIYPWGAEWDQSKRRNKDNKGNETTSKVSGYPKWVSGYGTYNQSGNVLEWCRDGYVDGPWTLPLKNPLGPAEGGAARVYRGGAWWLDNPDYFRAACRGRFDPGHRHGGLGFRLVRSAS